MGWLTEPFSGDAMQRALVAGLLVAVVCPVVGTWVVLRGLVFIGDAIPHGVVPGLALAVLFGFSLTVGAAVAAVVMVAGITAIGRRTELREDTGIGLLFVGMLALGVILATRQGTNEEELAELLFGAPLAVSDADLVVLGVAAVVSVTVAVVLYRPLLALAFDERKAATLGMRPRLMRPLLLALIALAVVASFPAVGALLVFAFLVAPAATAMLVARRVPIVTLAAIAFAVLEVIAGLLVSWHFEVEAGASMAVVAVAGFFAVLVGRDIVRARARSATVKAAAPR